MASVAASLMVIQLMCSMVGYCYGVGAAVTSLTSALPIPRLLLLTPLAIDTLSDMIHRYFSYCGLHDVTWCTRTTSLNTPLAATLVGNLTHLQSSTLVVHPGHASRLWCSPGPGVAQPLSQYRVGTLASTALHLAVHPRGWGSVGPRRTYGAAWVRLHSQAFAQHLSCATTPAVYGWDTVVLRLSVCMSWDGLCSSLYTVFRRTCALS